MGSCRTHKKKNSQKIALLPLSSKFGIQEPKRFTQSLSKFEQRHLNLAYMTNFYVNASHCDRTWRSVKMPSGSKRPQSSNFSQEEVLDMILEEGEAHLGMSSDEESDKDREFGYQSEVLR